MKKSRTFAGRIQSDGQMDVMVPFRRGWVWLRRFRYRCGYGVHSPFAFNLITRVIYEKAPFYAYRELDKLRRHVCGGRNSRKTDRLLFRLVNESQPECILEVGTRSGLSALYLSAARRSARVLTWDVDGTDRSVPFTEWGYVQVSCHRGSREELADSLRQENPRVGFLHFNSGRPEEMLWECLYPCLDSRSLVVVEGIHRSQAMKDWWKRLAADGRTGITFDLYELGLVFLDKKKIKQHYIVNF